MNGKVVKLLRYYAKKNGFSLREVKKEYAKLSAPERGKLMKEMFGSLNYGYGKK